MFRNIPENALKLSAMLDRAGYEQFLVGGCVRDMLMQNTPHDYDFTTNAVPDEVMDVLRKNSIPFYGSGLSYGTITAVMGKEEYEITTYRSEQSYEARHPQVTFEQDIDKDLGRRDFTINAIAFDPTNKIFYDPYKGVNSLNKKEVKAIGNPDERFREDPLRMLRAIRFAIRYGFAIEESTKEAIHRNVKLIDSLSRERITKEFRGILECGNSIKNYFLEFSDVVFQCVPELRPCFNCQQNSKYHNNDVYKHILNVVDGCKSSKFEVKMAALLHDIGKPKAMLEDGNTKRHPEMGREIAESVLKLDFSLTSKEMNSILELIEFHAMPLSEEPKDVKKILRDHTHDFLKDFVILRQADLDDHILDPSKSVADLNAILKTANDIVSNGEAFSLKSLKVNGKDLIEAGIPKGKDIGTILNDLLENVINESLPNEKDVLMSYIREKYIEEPEIGEFDL